MSHPIQPIIIDDNGILRFKENKIIRHLIDDGSIDLNKIATMGFSNEDHEQLSQLSGYSLSGYSDLSFVSDESVATAQLMTLPENMEKSELEIRNEYLRSELDLVKTAMAEAVLKVFDIDISNY